MNIEACIAADWQSGGERCRPAAGRFKQTQTFQQTYNIGIRVPFTTISLQLCELCRVVFTLISFVFPSCQRELRAKAPTKTVKHILHGPLLAKKCTKAAH